ncbi:hypothetical protein HDU98_007390 [Podochytrium sp. JEL0797]|nr:hypothetical protein HDU98_007390 [Podochytrium sp. JEL0797]
MIAITFLVAFASAAMAASAPVGKYFDNYIVIIMENTDLAQVLKSPEYTAYFNQGVEFTDYYGNHSSRPTTGPRLLNFGAKIDGFNGDETSITLGVEYSAKWLAAFLDDVNKSNYLNSRRTLIHLTFDKDNSAYDHYDFPVGGGKQGSDPNRCPDYNNCPADTTNNQVYGVLLGSAVSCYENTEFSG